MVSLAGDRYASEFATDVGAVIPCLRLSPNEVRTSREGCSSTCLIVIPEPSGGAETIFGILS